MNMSKETYKRFAEAHAPRSPILKNCANAFWIGGGICLLGQGLRDLYQGVCGLSSEDAGALTSVTLILCAVLTALPRWREQERWFPLQDLPTRWYLPPLTAGQRGLCWVWEQRSLPLRVPFYCTERWRGLFTAYCIGWEHCFKGLDGRHGKQLRDRMRRKK